MPPKRLIPRARWSIPSTASKQTIAKIKVYPGASASFSLYDDDGVSYAYEKNDGVKLTTLRWNDKTRKLSATGDDKDMVAKAVKAVAGK